jgi:micrococcal nuclease
MNSVTATVAGVGAGVGIAFADGAVWAGGPGGISKIDPATATLVERLEVPASGFYYGIAFADGSLWVSATDRGSLLRIDPRAAAPARERIRARVTAAVDGDTIKVLTARGRTLRVRLLGVDAPATSRRSTSGECGGRQARANLRRLSFTRRRGRMVTLTTDPTQPRTDPKGRLLAYAKLDSGKLLQAEQLRAGWATVQISADPFERLARFRRLQRSARSAKRGVWGKCSGDFHLPLR